MEQGMTRAESEELKKENPRNVKLRTFEEQYRLRRQVLQLSTRAHPRLAKPLPIRYTNPKCYHTEQKKHTDTAETRHV